MSADISVNRKALRDFHILERLEAGVQLRGSEVKSIRAGFANLNNAFARIERDELFLYDADVQPYAKANSFEAAEPKRRRKLLIHRKEIERLAELSVVKGHALVALRMYWKGHRVKVELGVGKGKEKADQRADLKAKATKREVDREVSNFNRKHG